MQPLIPL